MKNVTNVKKGCLVFGISLLLLSIVSADCDWKTEILLNNYTFNNGNDVNWTVKISKNYGDKANISVRGYVKDMLTNWQMDYKPWTNESVTNYRTCNPFAN